MLKLWLVLIGIMVSTAACAQGCGTTNPNCIVVTRPPGTNDNTAASTAFVIQAIGGGGGGAVTSVNTPNGTLTIAPNAGAVNADINLANANTWTAALAISPSTGLSTLTLTPVASSLAQALNTTQSAHGVAAANCTGCITGIAVGNLFRFSTDDVDANAAVGFAPIAISHTVGGASTSGEHSTLYISTLMNSQDSGTVGPGCQCYLSIVTETQATVNDGGTNTGAGAKGQLFAWNPRVILGGTATNWAFIEAAEIDLEVDAGASVAQKYSMYTVLQPGDAHQAASVHDVAYGIGDTGTSGGFKCGFCADDLFNHSRSGIAANGTLLGGAFDAGPYAITNGVDLRGFTVSGFAFVSGTGTTGFAVNQNGDTVAASYSIIAGGVQTSGVTCTAGSVNAATFTAKLGIVTHC